MREILFRGKHADTCEWVFGDIRHDYNGEPRCISDYCGSNPVDPSTVGQYTGFTDKNGKRIFEGDIVRAEYTGSKVGDSGTGTVVVDGCMFAIPWGWHKDLVCLTGFCNHKFEIIGNIHDNPELIAEGQP